jgi:hypothetical protein
MTNRERGTVEEPTRDVRIAQVVGPVTGSHCGDPAHSVRPGDSAVIDVIDPDPDPGG